MIKMNLAEKKCIISNESYMDNYFKDGYQRFDNQVKISDKVKINTNPSLEDIEKLKNIYDGLKNSSQYLEDNLNIDIKEINLIDPCNNLEKIFNTDYQNGPDVFHENEPWIQTYSGRRFNPTNPIPESIVIQDIAHALSNLCRFTGNCNEFYSVSQHSVLVSYLCDFDDALHGLLHDASEFVLSDLSAPLKHSGLFNEYIKFEKQLMDCIYTRFGLSIVEPESVKKADKLLLAIEARDLMHPLRKDWEYPVSPPPFKIIPLSPNEAEELFMKRFYELIGAPGLGKIWKKK